MTQILVQTLADLGTARDHPGQLGSHGEGRLGWWPGHWQSRWPPGHGGRGQGSALLDDTPCGRTLTQQRHRHTLVAADAPPLCEGLKQRAGKSPGEEVAWALKVKVRWDLSCLVGEEMSQAHTGGAPPTSFLPWAFDARIQFEEDLLPGALLASAFAHLLWKRLQSAFKCVSFKAQPLVSGLPQWQKVLQGLPPSWPTCCGGWVSEKGFCSAQSLQPSSRTHPRLAKRAESTVRPAWARISAPK